MDTFIFFDVGGVLIKDFSSNNGWNDLKTSIGLPLKEWDAFDSYWAAMTYKLCTTIDADDLISDIQNKFSVNFSKDFSLLAEFVSRFEKSEVMQKVCDIVSERHSLGLITNMYPRMYSEIERRGLMPYCSWETIIDSSDVKVAKPNQEIFKIAEQASGRKPEEILFVDNTKENLDVAKSIGWDVFHFNSKSPLTSSDKLLKYLSVKSLSL